MKKQPLLGHAFLVTRGKSKKAGRHSQQLLKLLRAGRSLLLTFHWPDYISLFHGSRDIYNSFTGQKGKQYLRTK